MPDVIVQSFGVPNYSGLLFNKGNTRTPFSSLIGGRRKTTNAVEFVTGQEFQTGGGAQPAISETASLTAPDATAITREQKTNVTQIFQESVGISYAKQSNMGTLSGINVAGQTANPQGELEFQTAAKMTKIARDIEYTFINGAYVKAANDATANKSRGILTAITSNVIDLNGEAIRWWDVAEIMKLIYEAQGSLNGLVAWVDAVTKFQLAADAEQNGYVTTHGNVNGLSIDYILTPLGQIGLYLGEFLPAGTMGIFNPLVCAPVEQPTPGYGNFFRELLAKTGAGEKYQIFGQIGLDHGPEWFHGKISGINTGFVKPKAGKLIYTIDPIETVTQLPVIESVTLAGAQVGVETSTLDVTYVGNPSAAATLAYKWQIASSALGAYADIAGATAATYTPVAGDAGKYLRCVVTSTGTATGTKASNAKKVAAAA
jgi:hypothetical protein